MGVLEFIWLLFLLSAFQPMAQKRMLDYSRRRLLAEIEQENQSRVILLVHRQETMSLLGFPLMKYIDIHDSESVLRAIQLTDPDVPIDLVLHTPGGLVLAALQIARALKAHPAKVTVYVPHYAMSGGTLIALAADEIRMCSHAVLGPIDPQLGEFPAASLVKVAREKPIGDVDDRTLILADVGQKAIDQVRDAAAELLGGHLEAEEARRVATVLATGTWTHDYPITPEAARELGLNVSTDIPTLILDLLALFPQPVRSQPSVEYLPGPRQRMSRQRGD